MSNSLNEMLLANFTKKIGHLQPFMKQKMIYAFNEGFKEAYNFFEKVREAEAKALQEQNKKAQELEKPTQASEPVIAE